VKLGSNLSIRSKTSPLLLILLLGFVLSKPSFAESTRLIKLGLRAAVPSAKNWEDFKQYDMLATYGLPWRWQWSAAWDLHLRLNATVGILKGNGDTGFIGSAGPSIELARIGNLASLNAGGRFALLSKNKFGQHDFGGPLQFVGHIGINFKLRKNLSAGYAFEHMSNANIYHKNGSLNMHVLELSYLF
jgi:hypothetical protein